MHRNKGFTLVEVLITLGLWSFLLLLIVPISHQLIETHQKKQFINVLQSDLLYLQNLSIGNRRDRIMISFQDYSYSFRKSRFEAPLVRNYPNGWKKTERKLNVIYFEDGTINQPGRIKLKKKNNEIEIIFPFGKGRGYIEEK